MDKQTAINLLGGTPAKAAAAMGYVSSHAVYMWPDVLSKTMVERITGVLALSDATELGDHPSECIVNVNETGVSHD